MSELGNVEYREGWVQLHTGRVGMSATRNAVMSRAPIVLAVDAERDIGWNEDAVTWRNVAVSARLVTFTIWSAPVGGTCFGVGTFTEPKTVREHDTATIARRGLVIGGDDIDAP